MCYHRGSDLAKYIYTISRLVEGKTGTQNYRCLRVLELNKSMFHLVIDPGDHVTLLPLVGICELCV
jgi:hypothetical protein